MAVSGQRAATMSQPQLVLLTTALQGIRVNDAVHSVVASSPRSARSGVSATRPPPTQPPRAAVASEHFVPDNALEVEGRTDWRMNVKAKPVRDAPLGKRIREFLSDVEARVASAKVGSPGTIAHERRHILASVVGGAADAGFLITLGQAIEQLLNNKSDNRVGPAKGCAAAVRGWGCGPDSWRCRHHAIGLSASSPLAFVRLFSKEGRLHQRIHTASACTSYTSL